MALNWTKWFPSGFRLISGDALNNWFNKPQASYQDDIVAKAGGGQANATQLNALINRVSTCATNADSVKLPPTSQNQGTIGITIINDGAADLAIFPYSTATIDGGAASASVTLTAGRRAMFWSVAANKWQSGYMLKSA